MSPVCKPTVFIVENIDEGSINCNETYNTTPIKKAKKGKLVFHEIGFSDLNLTLKIIANNSYVRTAKQVSSFSYYNKL